MVLVILAGTALTMRAHAQQRNWGNFVINVPETWSMTQKAGSVLLTNYNLKEAEPFAITLFDDSAIEGNPDSAFANAWKKLIMPLTGLPEVPHPRRLYTDEGVPLFQGFKEIASKTDPQYYQLNVYVINQTYQACLLHTTTARNYRLVQEEWQDRLTGIKMVKSKGKK